MITHAGNSGVGIEPVEWTNATDSLHITFIVLIELIAKIGILFFLHVDFVEGAVIVSGHELRASIGEDQWKLIFQSHLVV